MGQVKRQDGSQIYQSTGRKYIFQPAVHRVFVLFYAGTCPNPEQVLDRKDDDGNVFKNLKKGLIGIKKLVYRFQNDRNDIEQHQDN